jgi:hypothetical protein
MLALSLPLPRSLRMQQWCSCLVSSSSAVLWSAACLYSTWARAWWSKSLFSASCREIQRLQILRRLFFSPGECQITTLVGVWWGKPYAHLSMWIISCSFECLIQIVSRGEGIAMRLSRRNIAFEIRLWVNNAYDRSVQTTSCQRKEQKFENHSSYSYIQGSNWVITRLKQGCKMRNHA